MASEPPTGRASHPANGRWRYRLIVGLIWLAVMAAAAAGWRYARSSGPAYGPVILVSIESLRADHLPVYGYTKVRTPAIDALAADAVSFDRAYAHSPLTLPSHVSLLSGLLPFQAGVRDEVGFGIPANVSLLPQLLHKRGFKTGGMVSNYLLRKETGLGAAFGFFDDELAAGAGEGAALPATRDSAEALKVAERWIETINTARFFMFLHLDGPKPGAPPPGRFAKLSAYDARVAYADEQVGELVAFLKKRGLYNGGILVLTSDHGELLGQHGEDGHGMQLYEQAVRTPLIVKLPRRDGGGRHSSALVQHIDIAPTVLDLIGAPRPSGMRGRSLRNLLDSPTATIPVRQIYAESLAGRYRFGWSETYSLTDDRYRYIRSAKPELYDLLQDPGERTNLVETDNETVETMRAALAKLTGDSPLPVPALVPDPERGRLATMGLVSGLPAVPPAVSGDTLPDVKDRIAIANKFSRAAVLAAENGTAGAIAAYREVVAADPSNAAGWDRLSALLLDNDHPKEAGDALSSLLSLFPESARPAEAESRVQQVLGPAPTAERYVLAARLWASLGEKTRAAAIRAAGRKALGDAAIRKAEAGFGR